MTTAADLERRASCLRLRALALCLAFLVCPAAARAQVDEDARRKVEAALEALGGAARLRSLVSVVIRAEGREHRPAEAQGYDPERVTDAPHEELVVAYLSQEKLLYEHKTGRHDGTTRHRRWSYDGDERTVELVNVGPNPHTSENVIVHLPRERIVFQGDLFYFDGEATMGHVRRVLAGEGAAPEGSTARRPRGRSRRART